MKGYDSFFEKPGKVKEHYCLVCGTLCMVERNKLGPTSWVSSVARKETLHDYFTCPYKGKRWHEQALKLYQEMEELASKSLKEVLSKDLNDLLAEHGIRKFNPKESFSKN